MKHAARAVAALSLLVLLGPGEAPGQTGEPSITIQPFTIEGLVIGKQYVVDQAFGEKHGRPVGAPFELIVPTSDDFLTLVQPAPGGGGYVVFNFATPERELIENLKFIDMNLAMDPAGERLQMLAKLLSEQAFPGAVQGYGRSAIDSMRKIEIGPYVAVEVAGRYESPKDGLMYLRIVGIPNPERRESVFAIANIRAALVPLNSIDELPGTLSGKALGSFRYR